MGERWQSAAQLLINGGAGAEDDGSVVVRLVPPTAHQKQAAPLELPGLKVVKKEPGQFPVVELNGRPAVPKTSTIGPQLVDDDQIQRQVDVDKDFIKAA